MLTDSLRPIPVLYPLTIPYRLFIGIRNRLYDLGILSVEHLSVPVISVGNIALGGTGKSPFVAYLAQKILKMKTGRQLKVAILSRGYRKLGEEPMIVSDGKRICQDAETAGDEPVMMAEMVERAKVIVDRKRARGGRVAVN
ncbi:MAG: tetraacyldisaccharide 4'-kinase, partial [bacterium]